MYLKTDIPHLDIIVGISGFRLGKIYEIFGEESTSKSTIPQFLIKKFQEQYPQGKVLYIDTEQTLDLTRMAYMGIDITKVEILQDIYAENILNRISEVLNEVEKDNTNVFIAWDTIGATVTKGKKRGKDDDVSSGTGIAKLSRVLSQYLPDINKKITETNSILFCVNHVYDLIGSVGKKSKGGRAIKYYASVRIEVRKVKEIVKRVNDEEKTEGIIVELKTKKNKLFYPNLKTQIYIHGEEGVKEIESIVEYIKNNGLTTKAGAWYRFNQEGIDIKFNNADTFKVQMDRNPQLLDVIEYLILKRYVTISPLVKVRIIKRLNEVEEKLGKEKTELTDMEKKLAEVEYKQMEEESYV